MKSILLLFALTGLFSLAYAGDEELPLNIGEITKAIKAGDAVALGAYFDEKIELALVNVEGIFPKNEAIQKVKKFFADYKPESFTQVHQGASKSKEAQYFIGDLVSGSKHFRVYIYLKDVGGKTLIQEFRVDE